MRIITFAVVLVSTAANAGYRSTYSVTATQIAGIHARRQGPAQAVIGLGLLIKGHLHDLRGRLWSLPHDAAQIRKMLLQERKRARAQSPIDPPRTSDLIA